MADVAKLGAFRGEGFVDGRPSLVGLALTAAEFGVLPQAGLVVKRFVERAFLLRLRGERGQGDGRKEERGNEQQGKEFHERAFLFQRSDGYLPSALGSGSSVNYYSGRRRGPQKLAEREFLLERW